MIRNDLYQRITDQIVAQLENGVAPWQRPWATIGGGLPTNVVSRKPYRGINTLLLWSAAEEHGYQSPLWATYRQWDALSGHVNRGERSTKIIFWNVTRQTVLNENTGEDEEQRRFFCKEYSVFNLDQCGGEALNRFRAPVLPPRDFIDFQPAEKAIAATGAEIRHGGNRAYFDTLHDFIQLPIKDAFASSASYYATVLHELSHWSGHESRLRRIDKLARFGDQRYSAEELVAELAGAFLTASLGIPNERTLDNAAAYLGHWLEVLRSDNRAIFTAATAASAAADYILDFSRQVEEPAEEPEAVPF
ncbi:MAG: zincin-like metallopeptidase domain-containing protein [Thermoguttaceae bacterium]|jgi:antirestriction protein ArdC